MPSLSLFKARPHRKYDRMILPFEYTVCLKNHSKVIGFCFLAAREDFGTGRRRLRFIPAECKEREQGPIWIKSDLSAIMK